MAPKDVERWLEAYADAWRKRDAAAAAALFIENAVYRSHPFREPHVGTEGIQAYWRDATSNQKNLDVALGKPIVEGRRVAVEWWARMEIEGSPGGTLPGCLVLRFAPDGRCEELREYWHWEEVGRDPPEGWGR